MISIIRSGSTSSVSEMFARLVLQHLEKLALLAALVCLALIGVLH